MFIVVYGLSESSDWFKRYVTPYRVILCREVWESRPLLVYIYIFDAVISQEFFVKFYMISSIQVSNK